MLRASIVYREGPLTVLAVETVESFSHRADGHWHAGGTVKPVAVVVYGSGEPFAVDTEGNVLDIDELRQDVADLDAQSPASA